MTTIPLGKLGLAASAMVLATKSVSPPAGKGAIRVTDFSGYLAKTDPEMRRQETMSPIMIETRSWVFMSSLSFKIFNQKGHTILQEGWRFVFAGGYIFGVTWGAEFVRDTEDDKQRLPGAFPAQFFDLAAAHATENLWPVSETYRSRDDVGAVDSP
jgi:hypothetical protein